MAGRAPGPSKYGSPAAAHRHQLGEHMAKMRAVLRAHGYNVDADGPLNPRLRSAWDHYQNQLRVGPVEHRRTAAWNRQNQRRPGGGLSDTRTSEMATRGNTSSARSNLQDATTRAAPKPDKYTQAKKKMAPADPVASASKITKTHVKAAAHAAALGTGSRHKIGGAKVPGVRAPAFNAGVNKLIDPSMADHIAGEVYDPQIHQARLNIARGAADEKQHQADLSSWYGQAEGAQDTARQRDLGATDSARGAVGKELEGILASLGGSRGAGVVGAQGLSDLTSIAAQGASQSQYNADVAPIMKQEEAGAHARQAALASQAAERLGSQVTDLQGSRGQAKVKALMDIVQANNAARQSNFGNRLAVQNAALAAKSLGINSSLDLAKLGLDTKRVNAEVQANRTRAAASKRATGQPGWLAMSHGDRQAAALSALQPYIDPRNGSLIPGARPDDVLNKARATLRGQGFSSARRIGYRGAGVDPRAQRDIITLLHSTLSGIQARKSLPTAA